jgi:uncharacterized protein YcfL
MRNVIVLLVGSMMLVGCNAPVEQEAATQKVAFTEIVEDSTEVVNLDGVYDQVRWHCGGATSAPTQQSAIEISGSAMYTITYKANCGMQVTLEETLSYDSQFMTHQPAVSHWWPNVGACAPTTTYLTGQSDSVDGYVLNGDELSIYKGTCGGGDLIYVYQKR